MNRILVIRLGSLGDVVLATPLLRALRTAFPDARIDALVKPAYAPILQGNPALSAIFTTETFASRSRYDAVIDLQNNLSSRRYRRVGEKIFAYRKENWKKFLLVWFKINLCGDYRSVAERYALAAEPLGARLDGKGCEIFLSEAEIRFGLSHRTHASALAVCFGARHFTKRFPPERFATTLNLLLERTTLDVWLLGGGDDAPFADEILRRIEKKERVKNFSGRLSLRESASMLAAADAALSNDTGLMHVAAAFQKPIVALFGSSVKEFGFLPYKTRFEVLEVAGLKCRPCSHIGRASCPRKHFKCMMDIPEARLVEAVEEALRHASRKSEWARDAG
ncbi:MAG: glycosyltransferase family 9 protein [Chloroherpetonaceae bacterium]|nr:glycosyltransferase family 9 protein [Chloroherpetonaceae bacterium]MDW8438422.1 glycosyltransferase family 9 protein [Chloroherpetonaceae bacterium]